MELPTKVQRMFLLFFGVAVGCMTALFVWSSYFYAEWILASWVLSGLCIYWMTPALVGDKKLPRIFWFVSGFFAVGAVMVFVVWWLFLVEPWKNIWRFLIKKV